MRYHYENLCILLHVLNTFITFYYMVYGVWFTGTLYIVFENRDGHGHGVMRPAISDQT